MKINKLSSWNTTISANVRNIVNNAGCAGSAAKYYTDSSMYYFFSSGKQNPSVAKIIAADEIRKGGLLARPRFFRKYYSAIFDKDRKEFEEVFCKLYPKTAGTRTRIINAGRISMDKVTPKASLLEKLLKNLY